MSHLPESDTYVLRIDVLPQQDGTQVDSAETTKTPMHRLTLRHVVTGERHSFTTLAALVDFLAVVHGGDPQSIQDSD